MRSHRFCTFLLLAFLFSATSWPPLSATRQALAAEEAWKVEFEQVCGQTDTAMNMSVDELSKAVERCDRLKPRIEQLEATPRKIYLKRLQMCRNLYAYMLESRGSTSKK